MAKGPYTASDGRQYVVVAKGDTLGQIAIDYAGGYSNYKKLAAINDISDPDYIVIGQKIYLSEASNSSSSSSSSDIVWPAVTRLGFQANSDSTVVMTFNRLKHPDYAEYRVKYWIDWDYRTGDNIWYEGVRNHTTTDSSEKDAKFVNRTYDTYSVPANAVEVRTRIYVGWFRDNYDAYIKSGYKHLKTTAWSYYTLSDRIPDAPKAPSPSTDRYTLILKLNEIDTDPEVDAIQFEIYNGESKRVHTGKSAVKLKATSYQYTMAAGNRYSVRCRAQNIYGYSAWSPWVYDIIAPLASPGSIIHCYAVDKTSVHLEWGEVATATAYEIQYATNKDWLDNSNMASSTSTEDNSTKFTIGNLETGSEYFFRVRAKNYSNNSEWSEIKSVRLGTIPAAPTTWSSTVTAICGEDVILYWMHNSEDGSGQTSGEIEFVYNGTTFTQNISTETEFAIDTSTIPEDAVIEWRVRTAGITGELGVWSATRSVIIVAPAVLELVVTDYENNNFEALNAFPIKVNASAYPRTQKAIGYHLSVTSNQTYETTDGFGRTTTVNKDQQIYSRYFDGPDDLSTEISAEEISLENGVSYTIRCVVSMDSGLIADSSTAFTVEWDQILYTPEAEILFDYDTYAAHIRPYCDKISYTRHKVYKTSSQYVASSDVIGSVYGSAVQGATTTTGEQVYYGTTGTGEETYYCEVFDTAVVEDVTLSVYRREFDGSFVEIMSDIKNGENTYVTDPHPSLDYARYRIVAKHTQTGAISYYDISGYPVNCQYMIIQWDEAWSQFDFDGDAVSNQPPWSGSMIKLKANLDVSDQYSPDLSLVNYIGRKRPVTYYGTQLGETSSWNAVIPKDDKDALYALRRLAIWMGDVYVREPSGSGYWANINVSFNQKHRDLTIPVSFSITRVEGGM